MIAARALIAALLPALSLLPVAGQAQDGGTDTSWFVYLAEDGSECIALSEPTGARYFRDGVEVSANTDAPYLTVVYRPAEGALGQVAYQGGFPFGTQEPITARVGGTQFDLLPEGSWSWPPDSEADAALVAAMKANAQIELSSFSSRGTNVVHTFSLTGFGAAVDEAASRCGG